MLTNYRRKIKGFFYGIKKIYFFLYKNVVTLFIIGVLIIGISIYTIPVVSFRLGNIFFGEVKMLYNVKIAQFLYKHSVNPLFSQDAPRFSHYQLSRTYFIQGDLWKSLDEAQKELEIYPDNTRTYYILGLTYGYMNQEQKAIEMFSKFIEYKPTSWAARNDKAWLQFRIGDIDGAIETLKPIISTQQYNVWVQNTYCALMINKKMFEEAKNACENARGMISIMSEDSWGIAYPGNDPRIYGDGLKAMRISIDSNIKIINDYLDKK